MYVRQALGAEESLLASLPAESTTTKSSDSGVWGTTKAITGAVLDVFKQQQQQKGALEVYKQQLAPPPAPVSQTPSWLLPVGLGAAALVLVLVLRKKKG